MPGYGYGENGGRRRLRSSSRSSSQAPEKRPRNANKSKAKNRKRHHDEPEGQSVRATPASAPPHSSEGDSSKRGEQRGPDKDHGGDREKDRDKGHDKAREKDVGKECDKDRMQDHEKDREKDRQKDAEKDIEKVREKVREKDRRGDRDRGGERDREKVHDKDCERDRERDRGRVREKDREKDREKERETGRDRERRPAESCGVQDLATRRSIWRDEMETAQGADSDTDLAAAVLAPTETDDEVARKLAESRARREALMAKWLTRGDTQEGSGLFCPDTNTSMDANNPSDSDGEVAQYFEDKRKESESSDPKDKEALESKKAINRFILRFKAEHDGDMFQEGRKDAGALKHSVDQSAVISQTGASADDWNDKEGYYRAAISEVMDGRYRVVENACGKGVFSNVVKAKDEQDKNLVAIKIMRCNDMMRKAAEKEVELLLRLNRADRGNKKNVIRLLRTFLYRGHLCLVFECMWDNLRVALKKYTKDKGMSLRAVRAYTKQLLIGLRHIHRCGILHADIKPDNILITAGQNLVKICDLGSAMELTEIEPTPYLVSRFYRAPEICFGAKYGPPSDTFALGASLFELFTGKILFHGKSNNDMLRLFMELKGKFPHKLIKSGMSWKQHFDENLDFKYVDKHPMTRKKIVRILSDCSAKRSMLDLIMQRIGPEKQKSDVKDDQLYVKKGKQFADLLTQMTALDPEKRATPDDLLQHPFLNDTMPAPKDKKDGKAHA